MLPRNNNTVSMGVLRALDKILWEVCRDTREDVEGITRRVEKLRRRISEDLGLTSHPYVIMHLRNFQEEFETEAQKISKNYLNPGGDITMCSSDANKILEVLETKLAWLEKKLGLRKAEKGVPPRYRV